MSWLLDSDVLSQPAKSTGDARVITWLEKSIGALEIPAHITKDSDDLWEAADSQGEGEAVWRRHGVESFTCVALQAACKRSLETGAAIVFT